jgi:hypothetical protein
MVRMKVVASNLEALFGTRRLDIKRDRLMELLFPSPGPSSGLKVCALAPSPIRGSVADAYLLLLIRKLDQRRNTAPRVPPITEIL